MRHRQELRSHRKKNSQAWKTPAPRWATPSHRLTQIVICFVVVEGQQNTSNMFDWLGYASSGQRQWKYRDRARIWPATRDQSQQPTDRKVADFVDGLKRTTVLPSWMHSAEDDWNASNQRQQRHSQQHFSVNCRCPRVDRNRRSGCRQRISVDTVQRIPPAVPDLLYTEERVSAPGPTPVGLHTTPVVESTMATMNTNIKELFRMLVFIDV